MSVLDVLAIMNLKDDIINAVIDHVSAGLNDLDRGPVLRNAKVLDPTEWPLQMNREQLALYGGWEIEELCAHFQGGAPIIPSISSSSSVTEEISASLHNVSNTQQEIQSTANQLSKPFSSLMYNRQIMQICPKVNCQEKIIICLDISTEMEKDTFRSRSGDRFSQIKLAKRAIGIFLHSKHNINPEHEFAVILLKEQAIWMHPFTNNPDKVLAILEDFDRGFPTETFDMTSLFDVIRKQVELPKLSDPSVVSPPYIVRALLIYGRSHCVPTYSNKQSLNILLSSPHFFIDAFYIHEVPAEDNQCEVIFDTLCELDEKGLFYIFEVSRNPTRLYDCMAQLLPHPLQRPIQLDACYRFQQQVE
ncbi:hypothetical protein LSH36_27g09102 [Paralvinella palmiformis]|uniref:BRISC and BRCA1-A complex member 1 n=1 Tax=Paralvinella palmiformis TaxID=53620 RepID=A0AAD9K9G9_9ANNE|nr:hypothetical protein LSH36_27g09102 [Paralvinella palmiformis]